VIDPLFWLGLSILLVAVSLTAVLIAALPALQELGRAARSIEKLADTLRRELPPTLEAIRLTGLEISDLTDDVSEGVKSAGQVVKQVDQSLSGARNQRKTCRSILVVLLQVSKLPGKLGGVPQQDAGQSTASHRLNECL
jgi:uncharacterized protein YoxC